MGTNLMLSLDFLSAGLQGYIVPFLVALSIVVFFHELGHFLIARACGIRVLVFSIGIGPEIVGFNDRKRTRWKISAIPLGGYLQFFGDGKAAVVPHAANAAAESEAERQDDVLHPTGWVRAPARV